VGNWWKRFLSFEEDWRSFKPFDRRGYIYGLRRSKYRAELGYLEVTGVAFMMGPCCFGGAVFSAVKLVLYCFWGNKGYREGEIPMWLVGDRDDRVLARC